MTITSAPGFSAACVTLPKPTALVARAEVSVAMDVGTGTEPVFAGVVDEVLPKLGRARYALQPAARVALRESVDAASWRGERSAAIAAELLDSPPTPFAVDVAAFPDVELPRFSIPRCSRHWALLSLEHAVASVVGTAMARVFDGSGLLHLGPLEEIRRATRSKIALDAGVNTIRRSGTRFETFAQPVGYNQIVSVDGADRLCVHACLDAQPGRYRSTLILEEL